jgi:hypothetical protein
MCTFLLLPFEFTSNISVLFHSICLFINQAPKKKDATAKKATTKKAAPKKAKDATKKTSTKKAATKKAAPKKAKAATPAAAE